MANFRLPPAGAKGVPPDKPTAKPVATPHDASLDEAAKDFRRSLKDNNQPQSSKSSKPRDNTPARAKQMPARRQQIEGEEKSQSPKTSKPRGEIPNEPPAKSHAQETKLTRSASERGARDGLPNKVERDGAKTAKPLADSSLSSKPPPRGEPLTRSPATTSPATTPPTKPQTQETQPMQKFPITPATKERGASVADSSSRLPPSTSARGSNAGGMPNKTAEATKSAEMPTERTKTKSAPTRAPSGDEVQAFAAARTDTPRVTAPAPSTNAPAPAAPTALSESIAPNTVAELATTVAHRLSLRTQSDGARQIRLELKGDTFGNGTILELRLSPDKGLQMNFLCKDAQTAAQSIEPHRAALLAQVQQHTELPVTITTATDPDEHHQGGQQNESTEEDDE